MKELSSGYSKILATDATEKSEAENPVLARQVLIAAIEEA